MGTPPVVFTLPDEPMPYKRLWATPARDRRGVFASFEHSNPQEPLPNSQLMLSVALPTMYASNEGFRVEAIGAWMGGALPPAQLPDVGATTITATVA